MKLKTNLLAAFLLLFVLTACNDDDSKPAADELEGFLGKIGFTETTDFVDAGTYEFGFQFFVKNDGVMKEVIVKLPDDQTNLRVTIWEVTTQTILQTITLESVKADRETRKSIDPLPLLASDSYMITINTDDWYEHRHPDGNDVSYPITLDNIFVSTYGYAEGSAQAFPDHYEYDYFAGDVSFVFEEE